MIAQLLTYYNNVSRVYSSADRVFSLMKSVYNVLTKRFDCDVYYPTSLEVLDYIKKNDSQLYASLEDYAKTTVIENIDLKIIKNRAFDVSSLSDKDKSNIDEYFYKDEEIKNKIKCKYPNENNAPSIIDLKDVEVLKDVLDLSNINEEFKQFLEICNKREDILKNIDSDLYNQEELQKIIDDCFIADEYPDNYDSVEDVNLQSVDPISDSAQPSNFEFTNTPFNVLTDLFKDNLCIQLTSKYFTNITELNNTYIDLVSKKIEIEKKYAYSSIVYNYYDSLLKVWGNFPSYLPTTISTPSSIQTIKKYSKEVKLKTKKIKKYEVVSSYTIEFSKKPNKKDGEYFSLYDFLEDDPNVEKLKSGNASANDGYLVEIKIKKEFEKDLKNRIKSAKSEAKDAYFNQFLSINPLEIAQKIIDIKSIKNDLLTIKSMFKNKYENAKVEYDNFYKKQEELKKEIEALSLEYENQLEVNKCSVDLFANVEVEEPDDEVDFKELPNAENPNFNDKKYWVKFASLATQVGLLPIPQFTNSNNISLNVNDYRNPVVEIPTGGIAIDDDGIPRFLFWPIGFLIPTPISIDGLYRIPFPSYFKYLFHTDLKNPLDSIMNELLKFNNIISIFTEEHRKTLSKVGKAGFLANLPNANVLAILSLIGITSQLPFNAISDYTNKKIREIDVNLKTLLSRSIADVQTGKIPSDAYVIKNRLNDNIDNIVSEGQKFIDIQVRDIKKFIEKNIADVDFGSINKELNTYLNLIENYINIANTIINTVNTNCLGLGITDWYNENIKYSNSAFNGLRDLSNELLDYENLLRNFDLRIPDLPLEDILFSGLQDILQILYTNANELIEDINLDEVFPFIKSFINDIEFFINNFIFKFFKLSLFNSPIDLERLLSIKIPNVLLSSLSVAMIDFPELKIVGFLAQTGLFPYPIVMIINSSLNPVPGLVDARSVILLTIDITGIIKPVKINYGSYILPLSTFVETFLNESLGVYFNPKTNTIENSCDLYANLKLSSSSLLNQFKFKFTNPKYKLKDLYNFIELPNPIDLCTYANAKNAGEYFEKLFADVKLKTNSLPASVSSLQEVTKYGLFDFNGKMIIDEFQTLYNVDGFPNLKDVLNLDQGQLDYMSLNQLGISKKVVIDMFPSITKTTVFLQDDLPPWERLHLNNIPFDIFLMQFLIASKKGNVIPIPEVFPYLKM